MPPPILSPPNLLLRLPHPVRNNKNPNQLLDSNAPAPRQLLQLQENFPIQNLHKFHRLLTVTHLRSAPRNPANTPPLYMAHLLFLENNVQSPQQSINHNPTISRSML